MKQTLSISEDFSTELFGWELSDASCTKCGLREQARSGKHVTQIFPNNLKSRSSFHPFSVYCLLATVLFLIPPKQSLANFTGPVVSVLDADTIEVLHNTHPERVRLSGIDCPEKGQAYGH